MNLLPLVAIFLILLGIFSSSFFSSSKLFLMEKNASTGFLAANRQLERDIHTLAFDKAKKKKQETIKDVTSSLEKKTDEVTENLDEIEEIESNRLHFPNQPLNLFPLFEKKLSPKVAFIYEKVLKKTYENAAFFHRSYLQKDFKEFFSRYQLAGSKLLDELNEKNESVEDLSLLSFYPKKEVDKDLYYQMLRGTTQWDPCLGLGFPPLEKVFCFAPQKNEKVFSFPSLNPFMLECIFGKEAAKAILEKEAELTLNHPKGLAVTLSMQQLKELMHERFSSEDFDPIIDALDFSKSKKTKKELVAIDQDSGILVKHPLR